MLSHRYADALPELVLDWEAEGAPDPRILLLNTDLAVELGLDPERLDVGLLTGTVPPDGARPVAQGYAGHQFGGYSPRLGDGRALLLGELELSDGGLVDLHLKGSGRTPFARGGDGLAAVGPMLREYVISEAMHALGVPTTRSLAVVATGRTVQYARALAGPDGLGADSLLRRLCDVAIARHHPDASTPLELFDAVVGAQAELVAAWMHLGFVHGVMNTDNTTLSGETIDYGPCAFLDAYDPTAVFSSIDEQGRYAFGQQPPILEWNLARLAEALLPVLLDGAEGADGPGGEPDQDAAVAAATEVLASFRERYAAAYVHRGRAKLGLTGRDDVSDADAGALLDGFLRLLHENHVDLTGAYRRLGDPDPEALRDVVLDRPGLDAWRQRWEATRPDVAAMAAANPAYVPRNHLVEEALAAATDGDLDPVHRLLDVVRDPFTERPGLERYAEPAPAAFAAGFQTFCGT